VNIAIADHIRRGSIGPVAQIETLGTTGGVNDPPHTACIADRFQKLQWLGQNALGCGQIGNFDIHAIDAAIWVMGRRPVAVSGQGAIRRKNPHGDARDVFALVFTFDDGTTWIHRGTHLPNSQDGALRCTVFGRDAHAVINYWGRSFIRGGPGHMAKEVVSLYDQGAIRNIAAFHQAVCDGVCGNETVQRSVDCTLTCILGREAGERGKPMTMDELIRENRRLTVDLSGLQA
jgi:predicted dehydrogenase